MRRTSSSLLPSRADDAAVYARKLDALNRGLRGYNTERALPVFNAQVRRGPSHPPPHTLTFWRLRALQRSRACS